MLVIAMYIALEDIKVRAMFPESSTQELLHPISGAVCALAFLACLIIFDEAAGHTIINAVIIQRSLVDPVFEADRDYISLLRQVYREL